MNCSEKANHSIACTVQQCAHHCKNDDYCSLDRIPGPVHRLQILPEKLKRDKQHAGTRDFAFLHVFSTCNLRGIAVK